MPLDLYFCLQFGGQFFRQIALHVYRVGQGRVQERCQERTLADDLDVEDPRAVPGRTANGHAHGDKIRLPL